MTKQEDDVVWVQRKYDSDSLECLSLEDVIAKCQEALAAQARGEWRDLVLEMRYSSSSDTERPYIIGSRPEDATEREDRLKDKEKRRQIHETNERLEFKRLKKKFDDIEKKSGRKW